MNKRYGEIISVHGNMISVVFKDSIIQNEVGYVICGKEQLKAEVIRIRDNTAYMQVFESTKGIKVGNKVEFLNELLSVQLGPGIIGQIYDGLQNPLVELAEEFGFFLPKGIHLDALDFNKKWRFIPVIKSAGEKVSAGIPLGYVQEGIFKHFIFVPFNFTGEYIVKDMAPEGDYTVSENIAKLQNAGGGLIELDMVFDWPIKMPISICRQKFTPKEPLITSIRNIDTFFPIAKGGTYCIPGPFGAGKTVLQQLTSRYTEADVVIIAACGERAGEVVETLREFPKLVDPRTGRALIERTIIICNTSSMPVAAREASVYTAATLGEYYRQMGLDVLLLADSTSRWAQAMREISGRLEEIPGEEAYPAYLESRIAGFYERSGIIELPFGNGKKGSLTIGGTISPAGGNFEEPVTQATLKVVGAFHGLSRDRANARKFPSVDPLESWSKYKSFIPSEDVDTAKRILFKGNDIHQMMTVIGEEGTSLEDFEVYLKAELIDSVYLQQNAFDKIDAATTKERQQYVFKLIINIINTYFSFENKDKARGFFYKLRQLFIDWNYKQWNTEDFKNQEKLIKDFIKMDPPLA